MSGVGGSLVGRLYRSVSQLPKSRIWQASEQKGRVGFPAHVVMVPQIGQRKTMEHYLLSRMCAKVRTVLFLPRRVLLTTVVSDRRDFPDYGGDGPRRSAAIAGRTRHG